MQNKQQTELVLHGEAMIFKSQLPANVKPIKPSNGTYHIIADSETTGNHHVIDSYDGVNFFQDEGGVTYMENTKPTRVRCVHTDRHDPIELEPGIYEFGCQVEFDHFAQNLQNVRD
jgi:hypothetical protein